MIGPQTSVVVTMCDWVCRLEWSVARLNSQTGKQIFTYEIKLLPLQKHIFLIAGWKRSFTTTIWLFTCSNVMSMSWSRPLIIHLAQGLGKVMERETHHIEVIPRYAFNERTPDALYTVTPSLVPGRRANTELGTVTTVNSGASRFPQLTVG